MKNPYRSLAAGIMIVALRDAGFYGKQLIPVNQRENALAWIFLEFNSPYAYSFEGCCALMNLRSDSVRLKLRAMMNTHQVQDLNEAR